MQMTIEDERKLHEWEIMKQEAAEKMERKKERAINILNIDYRKYSHYEQAEQEYELLDNAIRELKNKFRR